jgi:hypothetical protein
MVQGKYLKTGNELSTKSIKFSFLQNVRYVSCCIAVDNYPIADSDQTHEGCTHFQWRFHTPRLFRRICNSFLNSLIYYFNPNWQAQSGTNVSIKLRNLDFNVV